MTSFILSFPEKTPAEHIVQQGKSKGMTISVGYIYATRSRARKSRGAEEPVETNRKPRGRGRSGGREQHLATLVRIVLDIGLAGTRELLRAVESRLTTAAARG